MMLLSDIKIIDLRRSIVDKAPLEQAREKLAKLAEAHEEESNRLKGLRKVDSGYVKKKLEVKARLGDLEADIVREEKGLKELERKYREKSNIPYITKIYVTGEDYRDPKTMPEYVFKWNRYEPRTNFREIRNWQIQFGAEFVSVDDDYVPEGIPADSEGHFPFDDAVLVKIPIDRYVKKRMKEIDISERAAGNLRKKHEETLARLAPDAVLSDEEKKQFFSQ
jgi:hypothetical protein